MKVLTLNATFLPILKKTRLAFFKLLFMWAVNESFLPIVLSRSSTSLSVLRGFPARWKSFSVPRIFNVEHSLIPSSTWFVLTQEAIASMSNSTRLWLWPIASFSKSTANRLGSLKRSKFGKSLTKKNRTKAVLSKTFSEIHRFLIEPQSWCFLLRRTASYLPDKHKAHQEGSLLLPFGSLFEKVFFVRHFLECFQKSE